MKTKINRKFEEPYILQVNLLIKNPYSPPPYRYPGHMASLVKISKLLRKKIH